jgi:hypothetical protein
MTERRDPLELLAMLGARSPDMLASGRGRPALTAQDIMAAMAIGGCPEGPYKLVLAKYAHDAGALHALGYIWWAEVAGLAVEHQWKGARGVPSFRRLADATLAEFLEGRLCRWCRGASVTPDQRACEACAGTGRRDRSALWWARSLDMHHSNVEVWIGRAKVCTTRLQDWEMQAEHALRQGLRW